MKKVLIISNLNKRFQICHFSVITPLEELGYEVHWASNFSDYKEDITKAPCKTHQIDFIRNPFNFKNYKAYKQLMKLLQEEKFDVIHCHNPISGILGRICGKKAKVKKIIYTAHGFHFYKGAPFINNTLYKLAENFLSKYTDALITINSEDYEYSKNMKLRNNGKSYHINGVGIQTQGYKISEQEKCELLKEIGIKSQDTIYISVGELNKNKNQKVIIEAIANSKNKNIQFLICGVGNEEKNLKELAEKFKILNQIHFLGFRNDIPKLLSTSDVFILSSYREGLPRSTMEAMVYELPCIVSNIRGNIDLIDEEGGILCSPKNVKEFTEAINQLANDKEKRTKMGTYNLEKIKQFDIENVKEEMKKIYEEILK